jgi:hypothetical protein
LKSGHAPLNPHPPCENISGKVDVSTLTIAFTETSCQTALLGDYDPVLRAAPWASDRFAYFQLADQQPLDEMADFIVACAAA